MVIILMFDTQSVKHWSKEYAQENKLDKILSQTITPNILQILLTMEKRSFHPYWHQDVFQATHPSTHVKATTVLKLPKTLWHRVMKKEHFIPGCQ